MRLLIGAAIVTLCAAVASEQDDAPGQVAKNFYELASQGRCAEAESFFTRESVAVIDRALGDRGSFPAFCREKGGNSPLVSLEVKKELIVGDRATVEVLRTYRAGMASETDYLAKRDGVWKIVVGESQTIAVPKR